MKNLVLMQQVHGNSCVRVGRKDVGATIPYCDALISNDPNIVLGVRVADCLPIALTDRRSRSFGLIHAGWRGLDGGIVGKTINKMVTEFSAGPADLEVAIGPHICQKHYEVKSDVFGKFKKYPQALMQKGGKEFLDLAKVAQAQLVELGVNPQNIKIDKRCTFEKKDLYSYRRNQTKERNFFYCTPRILLNV